MRSANLPLQGLLVLALLYTFYLARSLLLPIVLAVLLALLLSPAIEGLKKLRIPEPVGAVLVVGALLATLVSSLAFLLEPATQWIERLPHDLEKLEFTLRGIKKPLANISETAEKIERVASVDDAKPQQVAASQPSLATRAFAIVQTFAISAVSGLVLLYLLLAFGDQLLRKLLYLIPTRTEKKRALQIARTVRAEMTRYLATTTCINAGLGIAVGLATYLLGMPSPVLWGVMGALLNFVPYLGPLVNTGVLTIAALMSLEDIGRALAVPAIVYALDSLEGHFLTPIITGQTLDLNPVVILLGLLFSGWLWGVVGALIAIPMLVTLRILCDHIAPLAPISEFLRGKREEASEG